MEISLQERIIRRAIQLWKAKTGKDVSRTYRLPEYGRYDDATITLREYAWIDDNYACSEFDVHLTADDIWMPQERWNKYITYLTNKHKAVEVSPKPEVELDEDILDMERRLFAIKERLDALIQKIENRKGLKVDILSGSGTTVTWLPAKNITLT